MQQIATSESQIMDYFKTAGAHLTKEKETIAEIYAEVLACKSFVNNKDLIRALLERLECESDVVKLDIYRNALEAVLQRTPGDIF
ncbi:biofilm/acid-resistance regulator YmgB/AriR [Mixta gaviniae]|uniref:Histidine kinase n=1 Tax=Mixta gaviniae TaxID=665914 RepID=A0A1X1EBR1_9GAMM|nr:biofilm/acid-resistance regulator YmgB/AriR [Mixta gaviniae]AUX93141.1 hypothetical protein C2E15_08650 [Mixta gaviniae]ORM86366.1 hypothetical protein HA44_02730 [Mixta gaviniae]